MLTFEARCSCCNILVSILQEGVVTLSRTGSKDLSHPDVPINRPRDFVSVPPIDVSTVEPSHVQFAFTKVSRNVPQDISNHVLSDVLGDVRST